MEVEIGKVENFLYRILIKAFLKFISIGFKIQTPGPNFSFNFFGR